MAFWWTNESKKNDKKENESNGTQQNHEHTKSISSTPVFDVTKEAVTSSGVPNALRESANGKRLYNPYEGIHAGISPGMVNKPTFYIPEVPEQLFAEEAIVDRRSWAENVTYLTGLGYLGGAACGGMYGVMQKLREGPKPEVLKYRRLLANWLINGVAKNGPAYGNAFGILGFYYSNIESGLHWYRGEDDMWNSLAAGVTTGLVYRSNAGLRVAATSGAYGCMFAAMMIVSKQVFGNWSIQFS